MSKTLKILLIVFAVVAIGSGIIYFALGDVNPKTKKEPETKETKKEKMGLPNSLRMEQESARVEDGNLLYNSNLVNVSGKDVTVKSIDIVLCDKDGKTIMTLKNELNMKIVPGDLIQMSSQAQYSSDAKPEKINYIVKLKS